MSYESISPSDFASLFSTNSSIPLIDVRSPGEYRSAHVRGAKNFPVDTMTPDVIRSSFEPNQTPIYVICQSGGRSRRASEALSKAGLAVVNVEGGTAAAIAGGVDVVHGKSGSIAIERQVRIAAGSLVLVGAILGTWVHPAFYGLSAFIGAGLVFAGVTDTCAMGMMIAKMPWNRT